MKRLCLFILLIFSLTCCNSNSLERHRKEGRRVTERLLKDLQKIRDREDLVTNKGKIKQHFNTLVTVMIQAREHRFHHYLEESNEPSEEEAEVNLALKNELIRICEIEGGREILEKCQEEALNHLDAFEKRLKKKRVS